MLLVCPRHHEKVASRFGPDPGDDPDPFTAGVENIEAEHLIIIILSRPWGLERLFSHREDGADPFFGLINSFNAPQAQQEMTLVGLAGFQPMG